MERKRFFDKYFLRKPDDPAQLLEPSPQQQTEPDARIERAESETDMAVKPDEQSKGADTPTPFKATERTSAAVIGAMELADNLRKGHTIRIPALNIEITKDDLAEPTSTS